MGRTAVLAVAAALVVPASTGLAVADTTVTPSTERAPSAVVLVSGLNNPRQLSLASRAVLLIAEAGKGGTTPVDSPEGPAYVGATGSVSRVILPQVGHGQQPKRIVTGLYSSSGNQPFPGFAATGSDGVSALGPFDPIYVAETPGPPELSLPAAGQTGKLLAARPYRAATVVADITGYEAANDPDGMGVDSNPYAVLARPDGTELVADAAANDVLTVAPGGAVSVFHVFPNITTGACSGPDTYDPSPQFPGCNYVPTSLAADAAGNIYVGALAGETPGAGRVTELDPSGLQVLRTWTGFSSVTGLAVGGDGSLYVSELDAAEAAPPNTGVEGLGITGILTKVGPDGHRTSLDVPFAAGVAVDAQNNVFVSAWLICPDSGAPLPGLVGRDTSGQVWRVNF